MRSVREATVRQAAIILAVLVCRIVAMLGAEGEPDHAAEDDGMMMVVVAVRDHPRHGRSSEHDSSGP